LIVYYLIFRCVTFSIVEHDSDPVPVRLVVTLRWIPCARLVHACVQALHVLARQLEVVDIRILLDARRSDGLGKRNKALVLLLASVNFEEAHDYSPSADST
jgi:hypothetical protein